MKRAAGYCENYVGGILVPDGTEYSEDIRPKIEEQPDSIGPVVVKDFLIRCRWRRKCKGTKGDSYPSPALYRI